MKYIGSKAKFADEIVAILQGYISEYKIKQYVEPFAGGFNVIDKVQCEYRLGNDIDPLVCDLIETCRDNPALLDLLHTPTREEYYDVRDNKGNYAAHGIVRRCFYSPRIIPVFTVVVTVRRRKQKTAKRVTISRKANKTFNVNYPRSEISLSAMPIIAIYVSRRGSGF